MGLPQLSPRKLLIVPSIPLITERSSGHFTPSVKDTGAPITPELIAGYIKASAPSVAKIAGVNRKHAEIAAKYLQSEVDKAARGQYPSEFLTSDLMQYLDPPSTGNKAGLPRL